MRSCGTIAMQRLKCLDFDNQMATFLFSNYDCELPDLNLDRNKYPSPHGSTIPIARTPNESKS